MKIAVLIFSICLASFFSKAIQAKSNSDSIISTYEKETIFLEMHPLKGVMYTKNGETKRVGVFGNKMREEFENSPDAKKEINIAGYCLKKGCSMTLGGLTLAAVSVIAVLPVSIPIAFAGVLTGIAIEFMGVTKAIKGQNHFLKSVWLYNRDAIGKAQAKK
jgi:hypothetical protein